MTAEQRAWRGLRGFRDAREMADLWRGFARGADDGCCAPNGVPVRHHLVILREPYLRLMLSGRKRIECRLSKIRRPPFEAVSPGDLLWFKLPSGPVSAVATVGQCRFRELAQPDEVLAIARAHGSLICAADGFFEDAACWARYVTLVWMEAVLAIQPMRVFKSDQRAWVLLDGPPCPGDRYSLPGGRRGDS